MKLTTLSAIGVLFGLIMFGVACEIDVEYEKIAISGLFLMFLMLMWIISLLMELNGHFEKEEQKDDLEE